MDEVKQNGNHRRKVFAGIVFAVIAVIGIIGIILYIGYKSTHISTDDAFVEGYIHTIASKVPGTVKAVLVDDNQHVKAGDPLVEIDQTDYDVTVKEASSALNVEKAKSVEAATRIEAAKRRLSELQYGLRAAKANLEVKEANLRQAELDIKRAENLYRNETIPKERYDRTKTGYDVNVAEVKAAKDQVKQTEAAIRTQEAVIRQDQSAAQSQTSRVEQKEASLRAAELNKGYTKVYAPVEGYVTKKSVEVGNQIQTGQPLMAVVPLSDVWVVANYKETQLDKVKPGQKVEMSVDSYPGKVFRGKVDSIMAGSGAAFSLFPPENATGNYVKVVQRIPVKIVLDKGTDPDRLLRVGMSVVPTILLK